MASMRRPLRSNRRTTSPTSPRRTASGLTSTSVRSLPRQLVRSRPQPNGTSLLGSNRPSLAISPGEVCLATANRWSLSDRRKVTAIGMAVIGAFTLCCGAGMTNPAIIGLGAAVLTLGPGFIVMSGVRDSNREYVYGTAHVHSASPPPAAGHTGRCELHLLINAPGIEGVAVRVRDAAVPVKNGRT